MRMHRGNEILFPLPLWGGARGGDGEVLVQASTLLPSSRPPPCPPHKGERKARKRRCLTSESGNYRRSFAVNENPPPPQHAQPMPIRMLCFCSSVRSA